MRKISRMFLGAAAAVVMMMMMMLSQSASADDGTSSLSMVPSDATIVFNANVERLSGSPLYQQLFSAAMSDAEAQRIIQGLKDEAGFDLQSDISSLVVALPAGFETSQNVLMIAKGSFDTDRLVAAIRSAGGSLTEASHGGQAYFNTGENDMAVAFMGDYALLGKEAMIKAAIDARGGSNLSSNAAMMGIINNVDTSKDIWFAVNVPDSLKRQQPMLATLNTVRASLDLAGGALGLRLSVGAADANTATQFAQMIQAQLPAAAGQPMIQGMGLAAAINKVQVAAAGTDINVSLDLTTEEFTQIQTALRGLAGSMP